MDTANSNHRVPEYFISIDIGGTLAKFCFNHAAGLRDDQIPHIQSLTKKNGNPVPKNHFRTDQSPLTITNLSTSTTSVLTRQKSAQNTQKVPQSFLGGMTIIYDFASNFNRVFADSHQDSVDWRRFVQKLEKVIVEVAEFDSLMRGIQSLKRLEIEREFISVKDHKIIDHEVDYESLFPFLMVNVGSGVSILKVELTENGRVTSQRVGGTCLGGGFFLGLTQIMCGSNNFAEILHQAEGGDNANIDTVPGDYFELQKHMPEMSTAPVLVSFGKHTGYECKPKKQDTAKSLFLMTAINLAQLALMHSKLLNIERVVFTGFFCRNNKFMIECFNRAFAFFVQEENQVKKNAFGLRHDGYLGCLGGLNQVLFSQSYQLQAKQP